MEYKEEDYLQLSGIQHYLYCPRQWALIHIESQWAENERTVDGTLFHKNAHDGSYREKRGNIITVRGMYVHSTKLGITGQCDVVEFHKAETGILLPGEVGCWLPYPIEYKRGKKKSNSYDEAQVCAQVLCLEEMLCCEIQSGALFYGEQRHRQDVVMDMNIREIVEKAIYEMHDLYKRGYMPKVRVSKKCDQCSLIDICNPRITNSVSVKSYVDAILSEDL